MSTVDRSVIELDDLAEPRFSPAALTAREAMAEIGRSLSLEPEALLAAAVAETGLEDFGPEDFLPRLELFCRALRTEGRLSGPGVTSLFGQLTQLLRNRLLVQDVLRRHPEIDDEAIEAPIIIAGLPRSGTTHLHNLLAADPALRSLPYWESLEPVLAEREHPAPGDPDPRLARTAATLEFIDVVMPEFRRMHEMTVDHAHEEIQLLAMDVSSMLLETNTLVPSWRDAYLATDQRPSYAYLRRVLQVLQWLRGGRRWVLKSPQHLEQLGPLIDTFPDATVVLTHRDPVSVTASLASMMAYTARMAVERPDPVAIGRYWAQRGQDLLEACMADRHLVPAEQSLDVGFHELTADDMAVVEHIYDLAGQPMSTESRTAMADYMASHPRGRHGTIRYRLEPVGLDADERRVALAPYAEHFGVRPEGRP